MCNKNILKQNLEDLRNSAITFSQNIQVISNLVSDIFEKIKNSKTLSDAETYFDELDVIQATLALLVHEDDVDLPMHLHTFMSDFDNFQEAKYWYFPRIKSGEYRFEK